MAHSWVKFYIVASCHCDVVIFFCELGLNCVGFDIHESTDIAAIKNDLEQLSQVKTNTKTLLDNQQSLLELLQSNLTAMNRIGEFYSTLFSGDRRFEPLLSRSLT